MFELESPSKYCYVKGQFIEIQKSIIVAAISLGTLAINETTIMHEILDTSGQERCHSLAPMYYSASVAAIFVFRGI